MRFQDFYFICSFPETVFSVQTASTRQGTQRTVGFPVISSRWSAAVRTFAHMRNPNLKIFPVSAKTGEGMDAWCAWLREQADAWNR